MLGVVIILYLQIVKKLEVISKSDFNTYIKIFMAEVFYRFYTRVFYLNFDITH